MFSSKISIKDFDLKHTLECGQFFRYKRQPDGSYHVQSRDRFAIMRQQGNTIKVEGTMCSRYADSFLRLDDNFSKIKKSISQDPFVAKALTAYPGLRLLRQDPWECLISYVCSSASNIPKIQKNIEMISKCFGGKMECDLRSSDKTTDHATITYYSFPEIGAIDHCPTLTKCSVGYRDKFIHAINSTVDKNFFARLRKRNYEDARVMLMELPGVGPKVADCVCLFSLDHLDSFPVDVWVKRIMTELYGKEMKKQRLAVNEKNIRLFAREHFGDYAGYAQQYLFHMRRNSK